MLACCVTLHCVLRLASHAFERRCAAEALLFKTYTDPVGLNGGLQAVAECQSHFPELLLTDRPWRTTLDQAPFM